METSTCAGTFQFYARSWLIICQTNENQFRENSIAFLKKFNRAWKLTELAMLTKNWAVAPLFWPLQRVRSASCPFRLTDSSTFLFMWELLLWKNTSWCNIGVPLFLNLHITIYLFSLWLSKSVHQRDQLRICQIIKFTDKGIWNFIMLQTFSKMHINAHQCHWRAPAKAPAFGTDQAWVPKAEVLCPLLAYFGKSTNSAPLSLLVRPPIVSAALQWAYIFPVQWISL